MSETMLTTPTARAMARPATLVKGAIVGIGMAVVANVLVYMIGDAGGPIRVVTGWEPDGADLGIDEVIGTTVILSALGTAALWVFERFRDRGFREWAIVAALVAVGTILPVLRLDIDAGSKLALGVMHLVVGATAIAGHGIVRRFATDAK